MTSGAFKDFKGTIVNFDKEKSTLEVSVSVFNRETTVEVNFKDVEIVKS
jgi:transcription antitermination factor NusG